MKIIENNYDEITSGKIVCPHCNSIFESGIKIYNNLLKKCVEYVNSGWHMNYRLEDVAGIEINTTFIFVHFNEEDYTKDAYPISIEIIFK